MTCGRNGVTGDGTVQKAPLRAFGSASRTRPREVCFQARDPGVACPIDLCSK